MKERMHIDCDPKKLREYALGDEVTILVKGKIVELRDGKDPEVPEKKTKAGTIGEYQPNASISLEVEEKSIQPGGAFAKLVSDEDEDD
jgi:hypothetical protein